MRYKYLSVFYFLSLVCLLQFIGCEDEKKKPEPLIDIYKMDTSFKRVGYLPRYRFWLADSIEFDKINYLMLAFGNFNGDGTFTFNGGVNIYSIVNKAKQFDLKIMLSIGGGGFSSQKEDIWVDALSDENRANSIELMMDYIEQFDLHGIDVDLEGNLITKLGHNYNVFVKELREQLHAKGLAITAALPSTYVRSNITKETLDAFDFINVMIYDATGPWNPSNPGHHSSFNLAERALDYWTQTKGMPKEKIILGMPFYGHNFDPDHIGSLTFSDIIKDDPEYAYLNQKDAIYYNGIHMVAHKSQLALKRAGGIMIWELGQDDFSGLSLLKAVDESLAAGDCGNDSIVTYYLDSDQDGFGDIYHPIQACNQPSGYETNRTDCNDTDGSIYPGATEIIDNVDNDCDGVVD